ncbi:hypothetical protein GCM10011395_03580 [Sphingomonas psychrolutea]|uniref:Uncharacterized protein n=1 Tax=Sphingomonas psychrolutea TaxID=1259676 RepID=A0ABQ1G475_9SPHN|nr:hypothetical protein GCM10011395_03580 [Sphingomonas psychrolutea]
MIVHQAWVSGSDAGGTDAEAIVAANAGIAKTFLKFLRMLGPCEWLETIAASLPTMPVLG